MISSSRLRIVMLAMAVISVSVGAVSEINSIERPNWLPKLRGGGIENVV